MGKFLDSAAERFSIPAESLGAMKLSISGRGCILIENHGTLLDFSPECIAVSSGRMNVMILGQGLSIAAMDSRAIVIRGIIKRVDME